MVNLARRGGLRRAGAIVAGLLLATSAMAGSASAVGAVTITADQNPNPVARNSSATYSISITNSSGSTRYVRVYANTGTGLSAALTPTACPSIAGHASANFTLTVTTSGTTPLGSSNFYVTIHDYSGTPCGASTYQSTADSNSVAIVVKTPQTIAFDPAPTGVTVGAIGVSVSATATSTLDVAYSSTTPSICSVDGSSGALTLLAMGTCTIAADQAGNGTYGPAPQVTQNVAVSLNPQTITFDAAPTGVTVGAIGVSVSATATSTLDVAYSSTTPSICSVDASTGALTLLAIGTCTIAADQAGDGTYDAAPQVTQNVDVAATPAPSLGLVAAAVETSFTAAGDVLHFNFTLTNTGNTDLTGPFQVTSDKVVPVTCPVTATLALGASIVCTGTYTVTAADVTAGSVVQSATGQGLDGRTQVVTDPSAVTVPKAQAAATQTVLSATAVASQGVTAPPTSTTGGSSGNGTTPLFALLICLAFAGLGLLAVQAQRRTVRL